MTETCEPYCSCPEGELSCEDPTCPAGTSECGQLYDTSEVAFPGGFGCFP
jgi:hypothetical protein